MTVEQAVTTADEQFFEALLRADSVALDHILVDNFILVDVLSGSEIEKAPLAALVGAGRLAFDEVQQYPAARRVRVYGPAAVVTGRTHMRGRYEETPWSASSRYTHTYVDDRGAWRLASAQGTPIV